MKVRMGYLVPRGIDASMARPSLAERAAIVAVLEQKGCHAAWVLAAAGHQIFDVERSKCT